MADYQPLILRAVEGLDKNTGENRRALYERARTALVAQLRGVVPPLDESEITRQRLALEEAIRKVEAESARRAREEPRRPSPPTPPRRPAESPPRREEPPRDRAHREEPTQPAFPPPPPSPPVSEPAPQEHAAWQQPPDLAPEPPPPPAPPRPEPHRPEPRERTGRDNASLTDEAMRGFRNGISDPGRPSPPPPLSPRPTPPLPSAPPPAGSRYETRRPTPGARRAPPPPPVEETWEPPAPLEPQPPPSFEFSDPMPASRPRRAEPREYEPPPAPRPPRQPMRLPAFGNYLWIGVIALIGILCGALTWWQGENISNAASGLIAMVSGSSTPAQRQQTATTSPQQRPKINDRIGQPQTQDAPGVAQRVVLYEEDPTDPQGKRLLGTAVWRTDMIAPGPGRPQELAVRADVEVPERQLKMVMTLRRNADRSLPASHTIEIQFTLPADSPTGGVQNVPGVLMKQAEQTRGVPLAGLAVKVTPGFFLIGLSALETDMQRNLQLLRERAWFDIPMVYANNRRAILAVEKGTPGERAFTEAFAAWKQ